MTTRFRAFASLSLISCNCLFPLDGGRLRLGGCHAERFGKRRVISVKHLVLVCILWDEQRPITRSLEITPHSRIDNSNSSKEIAMDIAPLNEKTGYVSWMKRQGLPIHTGHGMADLRTLEVAPYERMGGNAAFVHLHGMQGITGGYIGEIPAGGALKPERHL